MSHNNHVKNKDGSYSVYSSQCECLVQSGQDMYKCSCGRMRYYTEKYDETIRHQRLYHSEGSTYRDENGLIHWR